MNKNNEMILRVLEAENKKDDKEAFDYVEKVLGFEVYKDKGFHVKSKFGKALYIHKSEWRYESDRINIPFENGWKRIGRKSFCKMDFENYLNTEWNKAYNEILNARYWDREGYVHTKYKDLIGRLQEAKKDISYYNRSIKERKEALDKLISKEIEKYTNDVGYYKRSIAINEERLAEARKEVALCRG